MSQLTSIEWTDRTWNPVRGCSRVSEGCRRCYAERIAARFSGPGQPFHLFADGDKSGSKWTGKVELIPHKLDEPLHWKPCRCFVNSMSDLFHERLPDESIARVFWTMARSRATFQVLTKRAERMADWFSDLRGQFVFEVQTEHGAMTTSRHLPLDNVWMGVSVEDQAAHDERVPHLQSVSAVARFLSIEPLLLPVKLDLSGIGWVIVGGESGPGARPMHPDWVRSIRDQCAKDRVPFFFKQWGSQQKGRMLDGVEHSAFPQAISGA